MLIPINIENNEILVRFIFNNDFKKKRIDQYNINKREVFIDTCGLGVSLQRSLYTTEDKCKKLAGMNKNTYAGFVLFHQQMFINTCEEIKVERANFEAIIKYTPLDENGEYLKIIDNCNTTDKGNPAHSDLCYINPAIKEEDPSPHTFIRFFSHRLMTKCKTIIDTELENDSFTLGRFEDLILE